MQSSQDSQSSGTNHRLYHQPMQQIQPYYLSHLQICPDNGNQGTHVSFQTSNEQFFTLDSSPATADYGVYDSPSGVSVSSNPSPFSPQCSYGSPVSGSSFVDDGNELNHILRELETKLLGPDCEFDEGSSCWFDSVGPKVKYNQMLHMTPSLDLKQMLVACAEAVSGYDLTTVAKLMDVVERMVSVTGDPNQRLGAYMLEGLRARLLSSGSAIYKKLKCKEPTGPELMSYMHVLYQICPYYKFAYMSANVIIGEALENEPRIHIIDFQIAQGSQWISLIQALARRPGGPPLIRITGVDDSQSAHARGGGLQLVGKRLSTIAESCGVRFEFHAAAISGCEVKLENLNIQHGEALAVNFPYVLHHMPDESVSTTNHRDRLLRLVKYLSPKVVTLLEQESNTNTTSFIPRFRETLDYYGAMFESIDAARERDDRQRMSAEEHCVARDIVNIIACEGPERVERHELLGKWRSRLTMAGFTMCPLSYSAGEAVKDMLREYSENYNLEERSGALCLRWKNRAMATSSAWR